MPFISLWNDRTNNTNRLVLQFITQLRDHIRTLGSNKINNETTTVQDVYKKIKLLYSNEHNYMICLKSLINKHKDFLKNKEIKIQDVLGDQEKDKDFISDWNNDRTNNTNDLVFQLINMLKKGLDY